MTNSDRKFHERLQSKEVINSRKNFLSKDN